jgi:uncharacterized repeat protein (TIGR03803 family)
VLYNFPPAPGGSYPVAVAAGPSGQIYGTTASGGASACPFECGTVYELEAGRETVLYTFTGGAYGAEPNGAIALDSSGGLYGVTTDTASSSSVVYKIDSSGQESVLHTFTGGADGFQPNGVIVDSSGNIYGSTFYGGNLPGTSGCGVVYALDQAGNQTILHTFTGVDGCNPNSTVVRDSSGNLYGTAGGGATA